MCKEFFCYRLTELGRLICQSFGYCHFFFFRVIGEKLSQMILCGNAIRESPQNFSVFTDGIFRLAAFIGTFSSGQHNVF